MDVVVPEAMQESGQSQSSPRGLDRPDADSTADLSELVALAEENLKSLQGERHHVSQELQVEASTFLDTEGAVPHQTRRFRCIYNLLRFQIHHHTHHMYTILGAKLSAMKNVQDVVGVSEDDALVQRLAVAVAKCKLTSATTWLMERGLASMKDLNKDVAASHAADTGAMAPHTGGSAPGISAGGGAAARRSSPPAPAKGELDAQGERLVEAAGGGGDGSGGGGGGGSGGDGGGDGGGDSGGGGGGARKRVRLPPQAVESMRLWMHQHWHNPVPSEEEKEQFAREFGITIKQISNWFINARMRVWRPAMRKALEQTRETGSTTELSKLLQHCEPGNIFKKFLDQPQHQQQQPHQQPGAQAFHHHAPAAVPAAAAAAGASAGGGAAAPPVSAADYHSDCEVKMHLARRKRPRPAVATRPAGTSTVFALHRDPPGSHA